MPGIVPKMSLTPGSIEWAGPKLGQHTKEVLSEKMQLSAKEIEKLEENGII